jgi:hypothetical protein
MRAACHCVLNLRGKELQTIGIVFLIRELEWYRSIRPAVHVRTVGQLRRSRKNLIL